MTIRWFVFTLVLVCASYLSACSGGGDNSNTNNANTNNASSKDLSTTLKTDGQSFEVSYGEIKGSEGEAYPSIPFNKIFSLSVTIKGKDGKAAALVEAPAVEAEMPEHQHGMNTKPVVESDDSGGYRVTGMLFHMPGWWTIKVAVPTSEGKTENVVFNVMVDTQ